MVTSPDETPVMMPVAEPAVAMAVLLLLHVPPAVASLSVMVPPLAQSVDGPVMAAGSGLTLMVRVTWQPVAVSW